jgi:hypothetical protein
LADTIITLINQRRYFMQIILKPMGAVLVVGTLATLSYFLWAKSQASSTPIINRSPTPVVATQGKVGVGTWATEAEFKDIQLNGKPLELTPELGKWEKPEAGLLRQTDATSDKMLGPAFLATGGSPTASNYTLTFKAKKNGGAEGFLVPFYIRDKDNYFWWNLGGWGNTEYQLERAANGIKTALVTPKYMGSINTGRWYSIKLECQGPRIKAYLDDKLIHDVTIP